LASKVIGPTGSRRRRWLFLLCLTVTLGAGAIFISGALAVTQSPSNFESNDGDMTLTTNGNTDWNCFVGSDNFQPGTPNPNCNRTSGAVHVQADPPNGTNEVQWVGGQKFDTACPVLNTGNNPPKDEFTDITEYDEFSTSGTTNGDLFFYGSAMRSSANGNSTGDVEFNQQAGNGTTSFGCRTGNDRLVAFDFLNGGTTLNFHILTWITSATGPGSLFGGNSGTCFTKSVSPPCWGANVITPSNQPGFTVFDGEANQSAITAANNGISGAALAAQQWSEFGVDLTRALNGASGGTLPCFPQQVWESRSSGSSFTSNPQDLEFVHLNTCGTITIVKNTDPRHLNQNFSYTANNGLSPSGFKLNDQNALTISNIGTGTTTSTITTTANGFTAGDKVGVTISGSNSTPSIDGNYTATVVDSTHVTIPLAAPVTAAGSAGSMTTNTEVYNNVPPGAYHVTEGAVPGGWDLKSLQCTNSGGNTGVQDGATPAQADITVVANGSTVCTYTNRATAEVKIIKKTDPLGIDQSFSYTSTLPTASPTSCTQSTAASFSLNDNGDAGSGNSGVNTQDCTTVPVGSYTVTEGAEPTGWTLKSLSCTADATSGSSGSQHATGSLQADIVLKVGGVVTCTYTNQALGEVKIIKKTDPLGIDKSFSYTSNLPTSGTTSCTQSTAASFSLNDNGDSGSGNSGVNTQDCTSVPVGSYTVTEGAEPTGWTLKSLSCTADATSGSSGSQHATGSLQADIVLKVGGVVTCTYTNQATAEVKIIKKTDPLGINQSFSYTSNLPTASPTSCTKSTAASFSLNDNGDSGSGNSGVNTQDCTTVLVGTYNVTETEPLGWTLESLSCVADNSSGSSGSQHATGSLQADITLKPGGLVTCTYQNKQPTGAILITKTGKDKNCVDATTVILNGVCTGAAAARLGGASFLITGTDLLGNPISKTPTTSSSTGKACVDGLPWNGVAGNTFTVTETGAPTGYSKDNGSGVSVTVLANATCSSDGSTSTGTPALSSFSDTPLTDLTVHVQSELAGATNSSISCVDSSSGNIGNSPQPSSGKGDPETLTANGLKPDTYSCTVVVDP
jgi:hypothetical protein